MARGDSFKLEEGRVYIRHEEEILAVAQAAWRIVCPIPPRVHSQVGWDPGWQWKVSLHAAGDWDKIVFKVPSNPRRSVIYNMWKGESIFKFLFVSWKGVKVVFHEERRARKEMGICSWFDSVWITIFWVQDRQSLQIVSVLSFIFDDWKSCCHLSVLLCNRWIKKLHLRC